MPGSRRDAVGTHLVRGEDEARVRSIGAVRRRHVNGSRGTGPEQPRCSLCPLAPAAANQAPRLAQVGRNPMTNSADSQRLPYPISRRTATPAGFRFSRSGPGSCSTLYRTASNVLLSSMGRKRKDSHGERQPARRPATLPDPSETHDGAPVPST